MSRLKKVELRGFKSIERAELMPSDINLLIGPNGAGKSNIISFFRLLNYMISSPSGALQRYIGENGGASLLLFEGPKKTPQIEAHLVLGTERGINEYKFRLFFASPDTLMFAEECCRFLPTGVIEGRWTELGAGHLEARLLDRQSPAAKITRGTIAALLRGLVVYHFQDTSREARVKRRWPIFDCDFLKFDAANLAPFLFEIRGNFSIYYRRIVETVRQIAPFFDDFYLEPQNDTLLLRWTEKGSDIVFSADQASDGTLRAMSLITALLQPPSKLPFLMIFDEPELGLHPYAIQIIAGLIQGISSQRQMIIATQSSSLLDAFDPKDVVVVERDRQGSHFSRLNSLDYEQWLQEYTMSELWDRNILGGRPKEIHS